ncbi:hypothetical protein DV736_g2502, partial [Chaetothyriales sp. CBS 134916]
MSTLPRLILRERTATGAPTTTYILSSISTTTSNGPPSTSTGRIDIVPPNCQPSPTSTSSSATSGLSSSLFIRLLAPLLPTNYPDSVSADYTPYQIYDSVQAFASTIAGLLAARAVLTSLGVGLDDESSSSSYSSTATLATLLSIVQESIGRFATIFFAHFFAVRIEAEVKFYRFFADVVNDLAFVLDVLSPSLPAPLLRVPALCLASACRAICGVCGGSSKAILSAHFATRGNIGELNAKDGSQETVVSLLGMWVGGLVYISGPTGGRGEGGVGVEEVGRAERLWSVEDGLMVGGRKWTIKFASVGDLLQALKWERRERSLGGRDGILRELLDIFAEEEYVLWFDKDRQEVLIVLMDDAIPETQLQSWYHAMVVGNHALEMSEDAILRKVAKTLPVSKQGWKQAEELLRRQGWQLQDSSLETLTGPRLQVATD